MQKITDEQKAEIKNAINNVLVPDGICVNNIQIRQHRHCDDSSYFDTHKDVFERIKEHPESYTILTASSSLWEYIQEHHEMERTCDISSIPSEAAEWISDCINDHMGRKLRKCAIAIDADCEDYDIDDDLTDHITGNWTLEQFEELSDEYAMAADKVGTMFEQFELRVAHWEWGTEIYPNVYHEPELDQINSRWTDRDEIGEMFGIDVDDVEIEHKSEDEESLGYWTIYWEPMYMDADLATQCGLTAFRYTDPDTETDYDLLALGGCGMDLSPKLDAYRALRTNSIPASSKFLTDAQYAEYVVGKEMFKRVMDAVTLDSPTLTVSTKVVPDGE